MTLRDLADAGVTLEALVTEIIERAEQATRYVIKNREGNWCVDDFAHLDYRDGFEAGAETCAAVIGDHVRHHLKADLADLIKTAKAL